MRKQSNPITVELNGELYKFYPRKNGKLFATIGTGKKQETVRGFIIRFK